MALPPKSADQTLDSLQAMINLILVQAGRAMNDPSMRNNVQQQQTARQVMPAVLEKFHSSLDELEDELNRAKAVMRRDLAVARVKRIKREEAEAEERKKQQTAAASALEDARKAQQQQDESSSVHDAVKELEDMQMTDLEPKVVESKAPTVSDSTSADKGGSSAKTNLPPPIDTASAAAKDQSPSKPAQPGSSIDDLFGGTPMTANMNGDLDFEAMFGTMPSIDSAVEEPDKAQTQAQPDLSAEPDLSMIDDGLSSLLPGLESYANNGSDSETPPVQPQQVASPSSNNNHASASAEEKKQTKPEGANQADQKPGQDDQLPSQPLQTQQQDSDAGVFHPESNFDDLFNWTDDVPLDAGDGDQFDNAFYGFDEL